MSASPDEEDTIHGVGLAKARQLHDALTLPQPDNITLDLNFWTGILNDEVVGTSVEKVVSIFQYFIDHGTAKGLASSPAVQTLQTSVDLVDDKKKPHKVSKNDRIGISHAILQPVLAASAKVVKFEEILKYTVEQVPLFNVWDCISFVYTLCVEPIGNPLLVELHLYQFRIIVKALGDHWFLKKCAPTTTVGVWLRRQVEGRHLIAFATTSAADKVNKKREMAQSRYEFAQKLVGHLDVVHSETAVLSAYYPGHCAEYQAVAFIVILTRRATQEFSMICFHVYQDLIYKMCEYCVPLRNNLATLGIVITDIWDC